LRSRLGQLTIELQWMCAAAPLLSPFAFQRSVLRAPPSCERCPMALMPRAGRAKGGEAMTARGLFISKAIAGYR
jgi:hypothetical protein